MADIKLAMIILLSHGAMIALGFWIGHVFAQDDTLRLVRSDFATFVDQVQDEVDVSCFPHFRLQDRIRALRLYYGFTRAASGLACGDEGDEVS